MKKIFFVVATALQAVSPQEAYNAALVAFHEKQWEKVRLEAREVFEKAPESPFLSDLYFYVGSAYFHQKDYEQANFYFSEFLKKYASPKYFEEAIVYNFQIAEAYQKGAKKHVMGMASMPQWIPARDDAYALYDEVIATLPRHEVAAKALYNKAIMMQEEGRHQESVEPLQTLIRRFQKHPLSPKAYLAIGQAYFAQGEEFFADRDFLEQARLNAKKFRRDFPGDEKVAEVETLLKKMLDAYAHDLWESATYYEKKKRIQSSVLYYASIVRKYPESPYAEKALERIEQLKKTYPAEVHNASYME